MRRRGVIATLGAVIPITGWLSKSEVTDPAASESTENGTHANASDTADTEICTARENTVPEASSGSETSDEVNPHELIVRNEDGHSRAVALRITDTETDETLLDQSCSLDGGEAVSGELRGPAEYDVTITVPDAGAERVTTVSYFDTCNDYQTTVTISPGGTITSESMRTEAACGI